MKEFKGVWIPYEIFTDKKLSDKEKFVYSIITFLSKENECTISNAYIGNLLNIGNVQVSRIINSLRKKGYIKTQIINKINNKNNWRLESQRDYSNLDFSKLYANNF